MKVDLSRASLPPEFKDTHIAAWQPVVTFAGCSKDHLLRHTLSNAAHAHIFVRQKVARDCDSDPNTLVALSMCNDIIFRGPTQTPSCGTTRRECAKIPPESRHRLRSTGKIAGYPWRRSTFVRRESENMRHVRARCEHPLAMLVWKAFSKLEQKLNYDNSHPKTIPVQKAQGNLTNVSD
ncbi:hypothetical protein EDB83DRAFT_2313342 [Lactarius deliciosus]|nr:hypothetical protein EDB83DRAFT_2313342 [Lactarius deliciosus]